MPTKKITKFRGKGGRFVKQGTPGASPVTFDFNPERDEAGHFMATTIEIDDAEDFFDYEDYPDLEDYDYHGTGDTGKRE